ncbi:PKD domain-containing protein [Mesonia aquimarina]|uniref:PKD domain-containing protein n=1 Tax=Mesonia aquimarina TaxID=1504967 RepID=UPI000EF60B1B|nr:DUF11 domain-containing protein [Mesonia aquimarina]
MDNHYLPTYNFLFFIRGKRFLFLFLSVLLFFSVQSQAQNCVVNAGVLNINICQNDDLILDGNNPSPIIGDVEWSQISGPSVIIDSPNSPTTTVSGYIGGNTYVFRYSAICGDGVETFQDKTVVVEPITMADAGVDVSSCSDTSGGIVVSGNTPQNSGEVGHWEIVSSNDAGLTIDLPNSSVTTLDLPPTSCGTTTIAWVIESAEYAPGEFCSSSSEIDITNYGGVTPVSAGNDINLGNCYTTTQSTSLNGTYGGCGLNGQIGVWEFVSGPSTPTINNSSSNNTNVSNLEEGSYVFRWTVTGPCASGSDEITVNVPAATQDVTTLGGDENIFLCDTSITQVTLTGDAPSFAGETVEWTQIGGGTLPPGSIQTPNNSSTLITNLSNSNDPYTFRYTLENANTGCSFSKDYTVEYKSTNRTIVANQGNNFFGECNQTNFTIPLETTGSGSNKYKILSGPASSPLGPFPTGIMNVGNELNIDLTVGGIYVINFARVENGSLPAGCSNGFDSITVFVSDAATPSNAGSDENLACGVTTGTLSGVSTSSGGAVWSQLSGPNNATITNPFQQNTTATGLISGSYVFQYITKGAGTKCPISIDTVQINVSSSSITSANAGSDQTVCIDAPVNLNANVPQAGEFGEWSQVSGPTTITFSDVNDPNALATGFSQASSNYTLRWTIDYTFPGSSGCSVPTQDDITITTNNNNSPTVADAGTDQCLPSGTTTVNLSGNASTLIETGTWTVTPSTGVTFINVNDPNTTATVPSDGEYLFTWTIARNIAAGCTTPTSDDVLVTIANDATANAGPDQTICGDQIIMNATLSTGSTGTWSLVSGVGGYTFSDLNDPDATVDFLYSGVYIFEWLVESGDCSSATDEVRIIVGIPPITADANIDQEVCNATTTTLNGNSYNSNIETGKWTVVSGAPNVPEILDTTDPNTSISGLVSGTYTFRWTITSKGNPLCSPSFDEMQVEVWAPATAGNDQTYCDVENVQLIGNENSTGTWTQTAGSTTGVTITQSPSNNYIANATVVPGNTYEFTYTTDAFMFSSGNNCSSTSDVVEITINSGASINPNAGPDQIICTDDVGGTITLDGNSPPVDVDNAEWQILYEPSGSNANINNVNNENTQVSGLDVPGLYVFEWVFSSDSCRDLSDVVRVTVFEAPSIADAGADDNVACQLTYQTNAVAPTAGIGTWSFATPSDDPSGGNVVIDNPNNPQTTLSNITTLGTYILTWTVSNGPFTNPSLCEPSIDTVSITFNDDPPSNADAGPNQELCDETQTTLAAVPLSDGLGTWMQTSGPNTANIASPNDENTTVFGLISGVYEFTWTATTVNDDGCSSQDTMQIEVFDEPSLADAGPNQVLSEFSPVILAGNMPTIGKGEWNQLSGPTTVAFADETDPTTQVSGTTTGIYTFQWEISNGNCISDTDVVIIEIKSISDLELIKTVSSSSVNVGDVVTFSIDVFNNDAEAGGTDATGVSVKDEIPDGFTLVPGSVSNNGVYNIGDLSITWSNLNINNGNSITLTFDAVVNSTGSYINTAQIIESDQVDLDSTPNNDDGDQSEDDEDSAAVTIQQADLSLSKTVSPSLVSIGDTVVFTLEVINAGPDDASNISVLDQLPSGYTYQSDNGGGTYDSSTGNWTINNLANGNSVSLTITATVNSSGDYFNIAEIIEVDQTDPDSTPDNDDGDQSEDDEDNASVTLETVDLELLKTVSPVSGTTGDQVTFTLTVDNLGSGNATGVSIEDYLPSGYSLVPGSVSNSGSYDTASSTILWSNLTIGSGSSLSITFDAIINSTGNYLNTAQIISSDLLDVDSTPDNDDGDQSEDDEDSALVTFISPSVDLSLTKIVVDGDTSPVIGTEVTFEITITNSSLINVTGVEVTDLLPDGYDFILFYLVPQQGHTMKIQGFGM